MGARPEDRVVTAGEVEAGPVEDLVAEDGPGEAEVEAGDALLPGEEFALFASSTFVTSIIKMWTGFAASFLTVPRWSLAGGRAFALSISAG